MKARGPHKSRADALICGTSFCHGGRLQKFCPDEPPEAASRTVAAPPQGSREPKTGPACSL